MRVSERNGISMDTCEPIHTVRQDIRLYVLRDFTYGTAIWPLVPPVFATAEFAIPGNAANSHYGGCRQRGLIMRRRSGLQCHVGESVFAVPSDILTWQCHESDLRIIKRSRELLRNVTRKDFCW